MCTTSPAAAVSSQRSQNIKTVMIWMRRDDTMTLPSVSGDKVVHGKNTHQQQAFALCSPSYFPGTLSYRSYVRCTSQKPNTRLAQLQQPTHTIHTPPPSHARSVAVCVLPEGYAHLRGYRRRE